MLGVPFLYVASFGPACWITSRTQTERSAIPQIYWPIGWMVMNVDFLDDCLIWYGWLGLKSNDSIWVPTDISGKMIILLRN